jgi:DNA-binding XRE family transcriptional regulator
MQEENINIIRKFSKLARSWLDWNQEDLAKRVGLQKLAIVKFEKNQTKNPITTAIAIRSVFEKEGILFKEEEGEIVIRIDYDK